MLKRTLTLLMASMLLGLAGCSSAATPAADSTGQNATARFGIYPGVIVSLPVLVAETGGYFEKHGVKASFHNVATGAAATQALVGGGIDFAISTIPDVVNLRAKGSAVRAVASMFARPTNALVCRNEVAMPNAGKVEVMRDLKGKKIGVTYVGGPPYVALAYSLHEAGMATDDVDVVTLGGLPNHLSAMRAGSVDCTVESEPMQSQLVSELKLAKVALAWNEGQGPSALQHYGTNVLVATETYLGERRDAARRAAAAIREADAFCADPANAATIAKQVARHFPGMDPHELVELVRASSGLISPDLDRRQVMTTQSVAKTVGTLETTLPYDEIVADL